MMKARWSNKAAAARQPLVASAAFCTGLALAPSIVQAHSDTAAESPIDVAQLAALAALGLAVVLYALALFRSNALKPRHAVAFFAGCAALLAALAPPLDDAAVGSFALHMVQHELLMIVAPPLLILGRPYAALAAALAAASSAASAVAQPWSPRLLRAAALPLAIPPLVAFVLHLLALWVWHVPKLFDAGRTSSGVHALQHAFFFWTALLFWWAVMRQWRTGVALAWLLGALIGSGALAALLTFAPAPLYAGTSLADQQLGGLLMWVPAGYALLIAALLAFNRLLRVSAA